MWQSTGSPLWLGVVAAAGGLPLLPLLWWRSAWLARIDAKPSLVRAQAAAAGLALASAALVMAGVAHPLVLLGVALAFGVVNAVEAPLMQAWLIDAGATPSRGVAGVSLVINATRCLAPALAVGLIEAGGPALGFLFNAATYLPLLLVLRRTPCRRAQGGGTQFVRPTLAALSANRAVLVRLAALGVLAVPAISQLPALVPAGGALRSFGALISALGLGATLAAAAFCWRPGWIESARALPWGGGLFCLSLLRLVFDGAGWVAWGWALVGGAALSWALAGANRVLQSGGHGMARAQRSALYLALTVGLVPLGQLALASLAQAIGSRQAVAGAALLCLLVLGLSARWPQAAGGQDGRRCEAGAAQS